MYIFASLTQLYSARLVHSHQKMTKNKVTFSAYISPHQTHKMEKEYYKIFFKSAGNDLLT